MFLEVSLEGVWQGKRENTVRFRGQVKWCGQLLTLLLIWVRGGQSLENLTLSHQCWELLSLTLGPHTSPLLRRSFASSLPPPGTLLSTANDTLSREVSPLSLSHLGRHCHHPSPPAAGAARPSPTSSN